MKLGLKIISWLTTIIGVLAILGSLSEPEGAYYAFLGGLLFATQGILTLIYIDTGDKNND